MRSIDLIAPAKVNLYLGIRQKREDGYHDVTTIMHALSMHDKLHMTLLGANERTTLFEPCDAAQPLRQFEASVEPGSGLVVSSHMIWFEGIPPIEVPDNKNLACRAIHTLAQAIDRHEDEFIRIVIEKHIPHQTGLGGGSADAAAALLGAADLWGIAHDDPILAATAKDLGADVCFFLHGGCIALQERGDELHSILEPRHDSLVIVRPDDGISTSEAYQTFDNDPLFPSDNELKTVLSCNKASDVPLYNNLEPTAKKLLPEVEQIESFVESIDGVVGSLLCGSGSGVLALCDDFKTAQYLASAAQLEGWWARTTSFSAIRAAKLPEKK